MILYENKSNNAVQNGPTLSLVDWSFWLFTGLLFQVFQMSMMQTPHKNCYFKFQYWKNSRTPNKQKIQHLFKSKYKHLFKNVSMSKTRLSVDGVKSLAAAPNDCCRELQHCAILQLRHERFLFHWQLLFLKSCY